MEIVEISIQPWAPTFTGARDNLLKINDHYNRSFVLKNCKS